MSTQHSALKTLLLACPACSQEMQCDDDGTLPLHDAPAAHSPLPIAHCSGSYGPGAPSRSGPMIRPPYVPAQIDAAAATEALAGRQCWGCSGRKRCGYAFCKRCFKSLPFATIGINLYLEIGDGFEKAFAEAVDHLRKESVRGEVVF